MLIQPNNYPVRNVLWQHWTPNECYEDTGLAWRHLKQNYRALINVWQRRTGVPGKPLFFEIRIKSNKTRLNLSLRQKWWDNPRYMDKVFWVFQKPVMFDMDGEMVPAYALEYWESQRVLVYEKDRMGFNPFETEHPSLLVPCECCQVEWTDTQAGLATNLRPRPQPELTQEQIDRKAKTDEEVQRILPTIREISQEKMTEVFGDKVLKEEIS